MTDSSEVLDPIIQSVRLLINNFFGLTTTAEDTKKSINLSIRLEKPSFASGDVVNVAPRMWPGINKPGGAAWITAIHDDGNSYDVKYILGGRSDLQVPAAFIRDASDLQEDRSQRTRRSKVRSQSSPLTQELSQPSKRGKKRSLESVDLTMPSLPEEDEAPQSGRPERKKRSSGASSRPSESQSFVFLATTLGEDDHALLRAFCAEFPSCRIVTKFHDSVTHIIVTASLEKDKNQTLRILRQRTMKYLQGLLGTALLSLPPLNIWICRGKVDRLHRMDREVSLGPQDAERGGL
jgi:hypothetical protein